MKSIKIGGNLNRKILLFSAFFGMLLSASIIIGGNIDRNIWNFVGIGYMDICLFLLYGCVISGIFYVLILWLNKHKSEEIIEASFSKKKWLNNSLIIFACWLPYFFMFYPGNMSVDSYKSIQQILGEIPLSNAHPISYTALVGVFVKIGIKIKDLEFGIALYSIFQMLVLAIVFGGISEWFAKKSGKRIPAVFGIVFFAFNPLIAIYAMTMWKDVLFSAWLLLMVVFLYEMLGRKKEDICQPKSMIILAILGILISFGRNNGIYILLLLYFCLLIYYKKFWKRLVPLFGGVIVFIYVIQGPVYSCIGVEKGNLAESLGVPLQQIAYTVKYDGKITEEQADFLNQIIPLEKMKEVYIPYSANGVKFDEDFNDEFLEKNIVEFLKVWAELLPANFKSYVKAYLIHTWGYWHIGTNDWRCVYGLVDSPGIERTNIIQNVTGIDVTENIRNIIEFEINKVPILNLIYSIAFSVWIVFFVVICFISLGKNKYILSLLPLIGNWVTIMIASPIFCEFRYMFAFHIALPIVFFMLYSLKKAKI